MAKRVESRSQNPYYQARIRSGRSVDELAEGTGYNRSTIYKLERGEIRPSAEFEAALSKFLNTTFESAGTGFNAFAEMIVNTIRTHKAPVRARKKASLLLPATPQLLVGALVNLPNPEKLHQGILELVRNETKKSTSKHPGGITFIWSGKDYEEFTDFYNILYDEFLLAVEASARITHLIRDGFSTEEKLDLIAFILRKSLTVNSSRFRILVVREMYPQSYVQDIYTTEHSGNLMAMSDLSLGEPSMAIWGDRPRGTDALKKYVGFLESNAEERVLYYTQKNRQEFFARYGRTETRTGDWIMLQQLPANATRPLHDFSENSTWAKRMKEIGRQRGGLEPEEMIKRGRLSAQMFRDRLTNGKFRQIMSRTALEEWVRTGSTAALRRTIELDESLIDNKVDRWARLKNIIDLIDKSNGRFQVALADEKDFSSIGWSREPNENIAWVVQGDEATVFEGFVDVGKAGMMEQFHIIINEAVVKDVFTEAFDEAWRSLSDQSTDQGHVRDFLVAKLKELAPRTGASEGA